MVIIRNDRASIDRLEVIKNISSLQDMTSRDLLQQRTTLPNGDTVWRPSPLVTAALEGSLAVLDGVHRINQGSFSVLHRYVSSVLLKCETGKICPEQYFFLSLL